VTCRKTLEEDLRIVTLRFNDLRRAMAAPHGRKSKHWKEDVSLLELNKLLDDLRSVQLQCLGLYTEAITRHENRDLS
jgi:hypothetical protein